jgi:hypothetical protein
VLLFSLAAGFGSWLALGLGTQRASAQTNFHALIANGPASNRLNLVFLSEGYTSEQFQQFFTHATNTAAILLTNQPFAEYQSYFNVCAIAVASAQSGSDHPASAHFVNTYFNSSYDSNSDYIITFPPDASGQDKVDALLNNFVPAADLAIMLVNDLTLGGSDGGGRIAISSISPVSLSDIPVHESGHVLANLGDEYTAPNPGYPDIEEPNTTRETNRALIKWNAWISTNTPVPTPPTFEYQDAVGLFEGAHYHTSGWFRPKLNCRMSSLGVPFCEVCCEALVLAFYREVRPIDFFTPTNASLITTSPAALNFTLATLQPAAHDLNIQWLTNGTAVAGATNPVFTILPASLGNGTKVIAAQVSDPTPLVRTDTSNLLSQTVTWNVDVSLPNLELSAPRWLGAGAFAFRVSGIAPQGFFIQASTNLTTWISISTNNLVNGHFDYTNQTGASFPSRMFRAVVAPSPLELAR